jgi:hypothetical protein
MHKRIRLLMEKRIKWWKKKQVHEKVKKKHIAPLDSTFVIEQ